MMLRRPELTLKNFYLAHSTHSTPCVVFNSARLVANVGIGLSMLLNIGRANDDIGFIIPHETGPGSVADKADRIICVKAGECGPVRASVSFNA
jgi:hypothetical protein